MIYNRFNEKYRNLVMAWIRYYRNIDGAYFYQGRIRHAIRHAKTGFRPVMPSYI